MDYSDVSSKRQRLPTNRAMMGGGQYGGGNQYDSAVALKNYGEYLGIGSSLVQQNQNALNQ